MYLRIRKRADESVDVESTRQGWKRREKVDPLPWLPDQQVLWDWKCSFLLFIFLSPPPPSPERLAVRMNITKLDFGLYECARMTQEDQTDPSPEAPHCFSNRRPVCPLVRLKPIFFYEFKAVIPDWNLNRLALHPATGNRPFWLRIGKLSAWKRKKMLSEKWVKNCTYVFFRRPDFIRTTKLSKHKSIKWCLEKLCTNLNIKFPAISKVCNIRHYHLLTDFQKSVQHLFNHV